MRDVKPHWNVVFIVSLATSKSLLTDVSLWQRKHIVEPLTLRYDQKCPSVYPYHMLQLKLQSKTILF